LGYKKVENRISKKTIFLKEMYIFSGRLFSEVSESRRRSSIVALEFFYSEKFRVSRRRKIISFSELCLAPTYKN